MCQWIFNSGKEMDSLWMDRGMETPLKFSFQILFISLVLLGKMHFMSWNYYLIFSYHITTSGSHQCTFYSPNHVNITFIITKGDAIFFIRFLLEQKEFFKLIRCNRKEKVARVIWILIYLFTLYWFINSTY